MFEFVLLHKEKIKEFLNSRKREVSGIQGILFFRLPVQFAVLVLSIDFFLLLLSKLKMSSYSVIALLLLMNTLWIVLKKFSIDKILSNFFFPENLQEGSETESNRIRSTDEVYNAIVSLFVKLSEYTREKDTPWKKLVFFSSLFIFFIYTDTFWFIFTIVNLLFFLPGIVFHPAIYPSFQNVLNNPK